MFPCAWSLDPIQLSPIRCACRSLPAAYIYLPCIRGESADRCLFSVQGRVVLLVLPWTTTKFGDDFTNDLLFWRFGISHFINGTCWSCPLFFYPVDSPRCGDRHSGFRGKRATSIKGHARNFVWRTTRRGDRFNLLYSHHYSTAALDWFWPKYFNLY